VDYIVYASGAETLRKSFLNGSHFDIFGSLEHWLDKTSIVVVSL